jgi:23S rRNA (adenine1618-N6)-methyltransferase
MHPRNKHQGRYALASLSLANPALKAFIKPNAYNDLSIDFANPKAVKALNKALLAHYYHIADWDIPDQFLCPPIPGRADYIHFLADLLGQHKTKIKGLDVGVGANVIYPLIGHQEYGWDFIGADINSTAIKNAQEILDANRLNESIQLRLQNDSNFIFKGIIHENEVFDFTMCNPPFHASLEEAQAGTKRKINGLSRNAGKAFKKVLCTKLNFGGQGADLICEGGELGFIHRMIQESVMYKKQCRWFTTLVSKASNLTKIENLLKTVGANKIRTIAMSQGQKQSRFVAWSFIEKDSP